MEREGFPVANLVAKMEAGELDAAPVFTDVKTFPYGEFRGCVDILSGGFPCQPFSAAGKREGVEDPRHLFPYIADGIRECQPRIVFLENVEGIISAKTADGESVLQYVLRELEGLGYRATAGVFSAAEVGAPHQRKRVFILGYSNHKGLEGHDENSASEHWKDKGDVAGSRSGGGDPEELADSNSEGLEGLRECNNSKGWEASNGQLRGGNQVWPSRPSEPQHDWEEPRVTAVGDTKGKQGSPSDNGGEQGASSQSKQVQSGGGDCGSLRQSTGQTESGLGRTANGSSSRVDRLRLLGNGVVPATAAKAFLTLIQRLND